MYEIEAPKLAYLLLLIPLVVLLFAAQWRWKKKQQKKFADLVLLDKLSPEKSTFKPFLKLIILLLVLALLVVSLVNPKIGTTLEDVKRQGIDIVFAMDVSKSMLANDIAPNRIEKAKQVVSQIINNLGNDRIGIVGYAGSAYPVLPMTTDYNIGKIYLQDMNTNTVSSQGTALAEAIEMASTFFDAVDTSKLIILLSDGEDHGEGAKDAAAVAKSKGIKIITLGLGTTAGSTIPITLNGRKEFKKDKEGNEVITKLNSEILEEIAIETDGLFIHAVKTNEVIEKIKNALNSIEKKEFDTQQMAEYQTQFQWFAGIAFFLLLLDVFFFERKTKWIQKLNLFNTEKP